MKVELIQDFRDYRSLCINNKFIGFYSARLSDNFDKWRFYQMIPNEYITGDYYIIIGEKLNELNNKKD